MAAERVLMTLVIFLLIANLWMLGRQLGLTISPRPPSPSYMEALMEEIWQKRLKDDPPLGTEVAPLRNLKGRRVVVVIERCTDCVVGKLKALLEAVKEKGLPKLVVVTGDEFEHAKRVLDSWKIEAEIVADTEGEVAKKLNAFFSPRVYIVEDGRILWKQEKLELIPSIIFSEVDR